MFRWLAAALIFAASFAGAPASATSWPAPADGTYVVPQFTFADSETSARRADEARDGQNG